MSRSQRLFEDIDTIQSAATHSVKPESLTTADASEVSVATHTKIQPTLSVERLRKTDHVDGDLAFSNTEEHDPYDTDNLDLFCDMIGRMGIGAKNDISSTANTWPAKPKKFESPTPKLQHTQEGNFNHFPMTNLCDPVGKYAHENDPHENDSQETGSPLINPKSGHESHKNDVDSSASQPYTSGLLSCPHWVGMRVMGWPRPTCGYLHDHGRFVHRVLPNAPLEMLGCAFNRAGKCKKGKKCAYEHEPTLHEIVADLPARVSDKLRARIKKDMGHHKKTCKP